MSKLEKSLTEWTSLGFINREQAEKISQHEAGKSSWVLSGILTLGIVAISIGVISLIAANWQTIPNIVKLTLDFALLIGLGIGLVSAWQTNRELLFEILLIGFLLLCLASIGLIAQIYQTGGELYQALLLWSFITVGVVFFAKHLFAPVIWVGGFLIAIACTAINSPLFWPIFHQNYTAISMSLPLLFWCITLVLQKLSLPNSMMRAFQIWTLLVFLFAVAVGDLHFATELKSTRDLSLYMPAYGLAILAGIGIWFATSYNLLQKLLLTLALLMFVLQFILPWLNVYDFVYAITTMLILGLIAVFFASLQQRRLFQLFLILLGLRLLNLYFQALGGLALTGLGLVAAGVLILAMGVLWSKYRTKLAVRVERWLK